MEQERAEWRSGPPRPSPPPSTPHGLWWMPSTPALLCKRRSPRDRRLVLTSFYHRSSPVSVSRVASRRLIPAPPGKQTDEHSRDEEDRWVDEARAVGKTKTRAPWTGPRVR